MSIAGIILIILAIPTLVGLMKVFEKAGYNKFLALVPLYNIWIWIEVAEKPKWWFILFLIPFINVFMFLLILVETAKTFNKNLLWEQGLAAIFPFVYLPYLGFSPDEKYQTKDERPPFHKSKLRDWVDTIIFAVVAASIIRGYIFEAYTIPTPSMEKSMLVGDFLFVSKFHYGAKTPNTPLALPFMHHSIPLTKAKSYVEWIKLPYYRFPGFTEIENNDIVVFNYPDGDTVALNAQNQSYYSLVRKYGWKKVNTPDAFNPSTRQPFGEVVARPVDKRENYVKRCVAIAGDVLEIKDGQIYINDKKAENPEKLQHWYFLVGKDRLLSEAEAQNIGISNTDYNFYKASIFSPDFHKNVINDYLKNSTSDSLVLKKEYAKLALINLSPQMAEELKNHPQVKKLHQVIIRKGVADPENDIIPHNPKLAKWNQDNLGPLWIPKAGESINLTPLNLELYRRIINVYEDNDLEVKKGKIFINGEETTSYTFKMDYYWMMGDNRHNSADSRFWGFVPMDHIVGTPALIWLSLDKDKGLFDGKIRFNRMFSVPE